MCADGDDRCIGVFWQKLMLVVEAGMLTLIAPRVVAVAYEVDAVPPAMMLTGKVSGMQVLGSDRRVSVPAPGDLLVVMSQYTQVMLSLVFL